MHYNQKQNRNKMEDLFKQTELSEETKAQISINTKIYRQISSVLQQTCKVHLDNRSVRVVLERESGFEDE